MEKQFEILKANRLIILSVIDDLNLEQLNKIPQGFKNNIAWNIAHLVVTQQLLCYKFSELPVLISEEMIETYKKGTAPTRDITKDEFEIIKEQLLGLADTFKEDYYANIFKNYTSYTTSAKVTLSNIKEAFEFNNFHEGIHLGIILSLKKLL